MASEKIFENFKVLFRYIKKFQPVVFVVLTVNIIVSSLLPFPYMIFSKKIFDLFSQKSPFLQVVFYALLLVGCTLFLGILNEYFNTKLTQKLERLDYELFKNMSRKTAYLDYFMLNSEDTRTKMQNASKAINGKNVSVLVLSFKNLAAGILSLLLVTGIIVRMDWILILILIVLVFLQSIISVKLKKLRYLSDTNLWKIDYKMNWFLKFCIMGEYAREIRLNQAQPFIIQKHNDYSEEYYQENNKILKLASWDRHVQLVLTAIQDISLYLLIGWRIIMKGLTVGDFSMTASGAATFKTALFNVIDSIGEIRNRCRYFAHYHLYMEMPSVFHSLENNRRSAPTSLQDSVFTFDQVSFQYPGSDRKILDGVSFQIHYTDVVAIVGENGAGKTTIVSLMCRLYDPTEGRILLNGIDIRTFDYDEYIRLFSVVSQDYKMFTMTVRENIQLASNSGEYSDIKEYEQKLQNAVQKVGLNDLVEKWPNHLDTMLIKEFDSDGVDVSGGESQKIALARAIYRDTPFLIMDEPTSALDPLSEKKVYETIRNIAQNKTVIFISHRLSSTQFADKILVIESGKLIENGAHKELIHRNGKYKELFDAQAEYYIEAVH